jgi:O-antigen/teichoic acid export membrane protein
MKSLRQQAFWNVIGTVLNLGFPLLTFPYISRLLGPQNLGTVNYVDSLVQFSISLAALGIPYYGIKEIARTKNDVVKQAGILYQLLSINFLFIFITSIGFSIYVFFFSSIIINTKLLLYAFLVIATQPLMADWFFVGNQAFIFLVKRNVIIRFITLIAIFVFIRSRNDFINYYGLLVIMQLVQAAWNVYTYARLRPFHFTYLHHFKKHLKPIGVLFATGAVIGLYVYIDAVILGNIAGEKAVGFYSVGIKIIRLSLYVISASMAVLFPALAILIQKEDGIAIEQMISKAVQGIILIGLPILATMLLFAKALVSFFAGPEFYDAYKTLIILSPLPLVIGLSNLFGLQILIPLGKEKSLLKAVLATTVLALLLQIILASNFSFIGTAMATMLTEAFILMLTFLSVKRFVHVIVPSVFWRACMLFLTGYVPVCLGLNLWIENNFIQLGMGAFWLFIWGVVTLYVFRTTLWKELLGNGTWIPFIGKKLEAS